MRNTQGEALRYDTECSDQQWTSDNLSEYSPKKQNRDVANPDKWRAILLARLGYARGGDGTSGGETCGMGSESTGRRQVSVRGKEEENRMYFDDWKNLELSPTVSQPELRRGQEWVGIDLPGRSRECGRQHSWQEKLASRREVGLVRARVEFSQRT